ncbi:MAG: response regulator [Anaerolineae bacterium]|nr:response regulator [Anaerolineae bacterium]
MARYRILIVDDQEEVSRMLTSALNSLDTPLDVIAVTSGEEAILEFARGNVDMLIADFKLPGISGLDLMHKLKQRNLEMKVLLVSGVTDPKIRQEVAQAGADAFFFKPIEIADFLDAVERALGLVSTMLRPEIDTRRREKVDEDEALSMGDRITQLRSKINATAAFLMGDQGQILVRSGALPDKAIEETIIPKTLPLLSSAVHLSRLIDDDQPDHIISFHAKAYNIYLSPVGEAYALVIITPPQKAEKTGPVSQAAQDTAKALLANLVNLGISTGSRSTGSLKHAEPEAAADQPAEDVSDPELETILEKEPKEKTARQLEADSFWDNADISAPPPAFPGGDSLSYEEALKLGLAPSDD